MITSASWRQKLPRGPFWTYFVAALFFNFGFSVFFFLCNVYLLALGHNERSLGIIGSWALIGSVCGTLPAGIVAQRWGIRRTFSLAIAIAATASALRVLHPAQTSQCLLAAIAGFCLCAWAVCLAPTVAALTTEEQRPFGFSLMYASGIGDAGLGAYAAGHLPGWFAHISTQALSTTQSERVVLLFGCAIAALALIPLSFLSSIKNVIPSAAEGSQHFARVGKNFVAALNNPFLKRFLLATAVWAVVLGAFPPFASVFFTHHLGLSLQSMGGVLSLSQLVSFVAILAAPLLFRRVGPANSILLSQLLTATALFFLAGARTLHQAAALYWLYTAAQNSNEPVISTLLMNRIPAADRPSASSYTNFVTAGSQIFASAAIGSAIVHFGYSYALYTIAFLALLAAILYRTLPKTILTQP